MPGATSPLGFPYPVAGDALDTWRPITQQLAEAVDDYLAALSSIAPVNWTTLAFSAPDLTGSVQYARRAGIVHVEMAMTLGVPGAASGAALTVALPSGFRPAITIVRLVQGGGTGRGVYVDTGGVIRMDFGGASGATLYGGFSFPV